jgi:hypothetical protein
MASLTVRTLADEQPAPQRHATAMSLHRTRRREQQFFDAGVPGICVHIGLSHKVGLRHFLISKHYSG